MEYLACALRRLCFSGSTAPGAHEHADLEACGGAGEQSIVIVTDAADVRMQVRPLLRGSDVHEVTCV
jgi:hypothetical protein